MILMNKLTIFSDTDSVYFSIRFQLAGGISTPRDLSLNLRFGHLFVVDHVRFAIGVTRGRRGGEGGGRHRRRTGIHHDHGQKIIPRFTPYVVKTSEMMTEQGLLRELLGAQGTWQADRGGTCSGMGRTDVGLESRLAYCAEVTVRARTNLLASWSTAASSLGTPCNKFKNNFEQLQSENHEKIIIKSS